MIPTCEGPGCGTVHAVNIGTAPSYTQGSPTISEALRNDYLNSQNENTGVDDIPYERMTQVVPPLASGWENQPARPNGIAPVPGTSNVPSLSGIGATEVNSGQGVAPETVSGGTSAGISTLPPDGTGIEPTLGIGLNQGEPLGSLPSEQNVFQNAPTFSVPNNPLLPPGYQEVLDYGNLQYMNGFLRTQIGKYVRIQQLIGSSVIEDRFGYLVGVGINYILLQEISTGNILALDFWNIKYVYIYYTKNDLPTNSTV